ncbi:hypothetical protein MGLY_10200 [Neomoorella glycerini]|jgi:transcriptional regulator with XRE-family HTH domain|uniref:Uncharacterized protein n=1 Tax=Neomoorella glycerini TaxID=55779 RepID=A0A6I5ZPH0_9FIRM|nr:helix-turn-helix domain-containing protein [Moorella glycerini]QGP91678.1 hypothetical protein MGLY_10200 [Moorella glycerini]
MRKRQLTSFGVAVKKALLEKRISQKEFCQVYNIPENRLSEILYGDRPGKKYREKIAEILDIDQELVAS